MLKNILKKFFLLLFTLALCSCATEEGMESSTSVQQKPQGSISIFNLMNTYNTATPVHFPDNTNYWTYIKSKQFDGTETYLFLPKGETIDNWTERLTIDHFPTTKLLSPAKYLHDIAWPAVVDQCYVAPNLQILAQSDRDLIYTYSLKQCGKNVNQVVVARIIKAEDGIDAINYATRNTAFDELSSGYIVDFLNKATI
jgi:hypothetical protein